MNYAERITQARKALENARKRLDALIDKCPHEETKPMSRYSSGGYDYCGETRYWDECTACGTQLNERYVSTGRYG